MEIKKSATFLMIPFHMEGLAELDNDLYGLIDQTIWHPSEMTTENGVFFTHIQEFLQNSLQPKKKLQPHDYRVFSLNYERATTLQLIYKSTLQLPTNEGPVLFNLLKDPKSLGGTTLIVAPNASIGLFIIGMELHKDNRNLNHLIEMNYRLHKTNCQQVPLLLNAQVDVKKWEERIACEQEEERRTNMEKQLHFKRQTIKKWEVAMRESWLDRKLEQKEKEEMQMTDNLYDWNIDHLLHILFNSIYCKCTRFNELRCHHFTYLYVDSDTYTEELGNDFLRIVRAENRKYEVIDTEREHVTQTFRNVYIGSSVEGSALMTLSPKVNKEFFGQFYENQILKRYLWIYLMIVVQRYTLIFMLKMLTNVDDHTTKSSNVSLSRLRTFFQLLNEVKVNTYFTEVSEFTHHNQFYQFCSNRLGIQRTFIDIDQKMQTLNEHLVQLSNVRKEKYQRLLSYLLAILAIASASNDSLGWLKEVYFIAEKPIFYIVVAWAIPLLCLVLIFHIWRKDK